MGANSAIQWTDHTFNPWRGCTMVSPGCANCYAETLSGRNPKTLGVWGPRGTRVVAAETYWRQPVAWDREAKAAGVRRRVFCASLADVFEGPETMPADSVPAVDVARCRLFRLIEDTPHLDWLLLTKRPANVWPTYGAWLRARLWGDGGADRLPGNVWIGTSVEDQQRADERIPELLKVPAAVRFLSVEPLLGPIDLMGIQFDRLTRMNVLEGVGHSQRSQCQSIPNARCPRVHWVIIGGESGGGARPCYVSWVRYLVEQCREAGVAAFVKQLGAVPMDAHECEDACGVHRLDLIDKKGGDPEEWPADLRVRELPAAHTT